MGRVTHVEGGPRARSQILFLIVWLSVTALLVVALQVVDSPQALGDDGGREVPTVAADYPLRPADPAAEEEPSALYGGALWSILDVRVVNGASRFDDAIVELDVAVTNTLATTQVRVPDSMVRLMTDEGRQIDGGHFVDAGSRLTLDPGERQDVTVRFLIGFTQEPDPSELFFEIAEPGRTPAWIPLDGELEPRPYPVLAAVDQSVLSAPDPVDDTRQILIEPQAASVGVDAGPYRATIDERLAVVKVLVQRAAVGEDDLVADTSFWAVEHDGETTPAVLVARHETTVGSLGEELTILLTFPATADELTVVAGPGTTTEARFPLVIPS